MAIFLVDFENVQSPGLDGIELLEENDTVYIFYTQNAPAVRFETVSLILKSKAKIYYIYVEAGGKNALDFQLSGFLGYLAAVSEDRTFYIVSSDGGFSYVKNFFTKKFNVGITIKMCPKISNTVKVKETAVLAEKTAVPIESAVSEETAPENFCEPRTEHETAEADNSAENEKKVKEIIKAALSSEKTNTKERNIVRCIIKASTNKQEFYTKMTSKFGMEKGLAFYKAVRSEYANLKQLL